MPLTLISVPACTVRIHRISVDDRAGCKITTLIEVIPLAVDLQPLACRIPSGDNVLIHSHSVHIEGMAIGYNI